MKSDKLIAIADLTQQVAQKMGDEFVCRLWKNHVLQGLVSYYDAAELAHHCTCG